MTNDSLVEKAFPNRPWFAVRCVFYDSTNKLYEERVTLFRASNNEEALKKAEEDAQGVCEALEGYRYTGYAETFHLFDEHFEDGVELYATLRRSDLDVEAYIKQFVRTGDEVGFKEQR